MKRTSAKPTTRSTSATRAKPKAKPATTKAKPAATKARSKATTPKAAPVARKKPAPRADLGKPIDGFFKRQSAALQPIARALRALIESAAPEARSSIKWGMPFFMIGDSMVCAIGAHKAHVNLILSGPPGTFSDPDGLLSGDGKTGRHLKLTASDTLPTAAVRGWLRTAVARARQG
ncbi:MAG: DUF1801 domain-containing protein [Myxococcales bacterium]|nr:DUF1801 domain-containing protein [Myxococcales bacterium]